MSKYALVSGASRGIGKAIAIQLVKDFNYTILLNYNNNHTAAKEVKLEIEALGGKAVLMPFNVADGNAVKASLDQWKEQNPEAVIEVLVNNAGITKDNLMMWMEESEFDDVVQTSLKGFFHLSKYVLEEMIAQRYGRIINVASVSGLKGNTGQVNYSAAKGGLIAATKSLAQEVARRKVTVNAVAPGFIKSDMTAELDQKMMKKMIPMQRFGEAQEVADVVAFLASPKASYVTGEVININGGIYS